MNAYAEQLKDEYEKRIRVLERTVHGEKERRRQIGFHYKQLEALLKKLQNDNDGLEKKLKAMKKCASCSHLDQRSKSYNALNELLHGSVPALEPEAVASTGPAPASSKNNEMKDVKVANNDLQQCVDKLQNMLKEKGREAIASEKYYNEAVLEREQRIAQLQNELAKRWVGPSAKPAVNQEAEAKLKALLKERTELLNRIQRLENENKENRNFAGDGMQSSARSATTSAGAIMEDDVNPYCGYCRDRVKSWNKMMSGREMDFIGLTNNEPNDREQQVAVLEKKLKEVSLALDTERERSKAIEYALQDENDTLSAKYQKLRRQYESLEVELGKRRNAELIARDKAQQNGSAAFIGDTRLIAHLKSDLEKSNATVLSLRRELDAAKQAIYSDTRLATGQFKRQIEELEKSKRESARMLESQKKRLLELQNEVADLATEKCALQRKCIELERANNLAVQEKLEQLGVIETLRDELSRLEEEQTKVLKANEAQMEAYQDLIKQKDDERGALIAELCAANRREVPLHDSVGEFQNRHAEADENRELLKELRELNHEKQAISDKVAGLENELASVKEQLRCKTEEVQKEVILKNSMHDDLAKARTMLLEKEAEMLDLNNQLKVAEVNIMKLETELANATDRFQIEQTTASTLKVSVEELEDILQAKSSEIIMAAQERQRCLNEMQKMKESKYDLETKLTLQGRELKEAREKLTALRKKIRELEQEAMNSAEKSLSGSPTQSRGCKTEKCNYLDYLPK